MIKNINFHFLKISNRLKFFIIKSLYSFLNGSLNLLTHSFFDFKNVKLKNKVNKILVLRNGSIGDCVTSFPTIFSIANQYPHAKLDILTNSGNNNFIGMEYLLSENIYSKIINYFGMDYKFLYKLIKKNEYDLFINLSQDKTTWFREFKLLLFIKLCSIPTAIGFEIGTVRLFLRIQNENFSRKSERDRLGSIIEKIGIPYLRNNYPLKKDIKSENEVFKNLESLNILEKKKNIGIVIGAKRELNKWPINYWKEICEKLNEKGYNILIIGGNDDKKDSEILKSNRVFDFCGKFNISCSIELIKNCSLLISNDTGPMHLAYAVRTPVIAIFNAWQLENVWFPTLENSVVLMDTKIDCAFCYDNKCRNNKCMQSIKPNDVIYNIERLLI